MFIKASSINVKFSKKFLHECFCFVDIQQHIRIEVCTGIE